MKILPILPELSCRCVFPPEWVLGGPPDFGSIDPDNSSFESAGLPNGVANSLGYFVVWTEVKGPFEIWLKPGRSSALLRVGESWNDHIEFAEGTLRGLSQNIGSSDRDWHIIDLDFSSYRVGIERIESELGLELILSFATVWSYLSGVLSSMAPDAHQNVRVLDQLIEFLTDFQASEQADRSRRPEGPVTALLLEATALLSKLRLGQASVAQVVARLSQFDETEVVKRCAVEVFERAPIPGIQNIELRPLGSSVELLYDKRYYRRIDLQPEKLLQELRLFVESPQLMGRVLGKIAHLVATTVQTEHGEGLSFTFVDIRTAVRNELELISSAPPDQRVEVLDRFLEWLRAQVAHLPRDSGEGASMLSELESAKNQIDRGMDVELALTDFRYIYSFE